MALVCLVVIVEYIRMSDCLVENVSLVSTCGNVFFEQLSDGKRMSSCEGGVAQLQQELLSLQQELLSGGTHCLVMRLHVACI